MLDIFNNTCPMCFRRKTRCSCAVEAISLDSDSDSATKPLTKPLTKPIPSTEINSESQIPRHANKLAVCNSKSNNDALAVEDSQNLWLNTSKVYDMTEKKIQAITPGSRPCAAFIAVFKDGKQLLNLGRLDLTNNCAEQLSTNITGVVLEGPFQVALQSNAPIYAQEDYKAWLSGD